MRKKQLVEEAIERFDYEHDDLDLHYQIYLVHEEKWPFLKFIKDEEMKKKSFTMLHEAGFRLNASCTCSYFHNEDVMFFVTNAESKYVERKHDYESYIWDLRTINKHVCYSYGVVDIKDIYSLLKALKEFYDKPTEGCSS